MAQIYMKMLRTRRFEESCAELFVKGLVHGTTHLYIGEEAVAAGICSALQKGDSITSTHRGHGHCISFGMDTSAMMAEYLGREAGCCKGRGGSMHMFDIENGNLGENGIVGGGCAIAAGAALTHKKRGNGAVAVCFLGEGATNEGSFHEAANLSSVWKLPVLFVCEDNKYGMSMSSDKSIKVKDISLRALSYGFPGKTIDGNDAMEIYTEALAAREYVRDNGPMLLVCDTYRISGHSKSDTNAYRTKEEIASWRKKDPITRMKKIMAASGFSENELKCIEEDARREIENAVEFAINAPYPSPETVYDYIYA